MNRYLLLGSAFVTSALVVGCSATGRVGGEVDVPLPAGGRVKGTFELGVGGDTTAEIEANKPICLEICYSGADGATLGCETVELPHSGQVPPGAVRWEARVVDCPQPEDGDGGNMYDPLAAFQQPGQGVPAPIPLTRWEIIGGDLFPQTDGGTSVTYSFAIRAVSLAQALSQRDAVLAGGIGTAPGPGFNVLFYSETEAEFDDAGLATGVRVRQAELNDDFVTWSLSVNGAVVADLGSTGNVAHYSAANGWTVVETFVPTSAFETDPNSFDNLAQSEWTTVGTAPLWTASQRLYAN